MLNRQELEERKRAVVVQHGPWISHNLDLGHGVYSMAPGVVDGNLVRLRRIVQLVSDLALAPIKELRVLDLGAFEGLFAVELARRGASVVAVEGRKASLEKMRVAKDGHELDNLELYLGDVRDLTPETFGRFDVVLCLGLLYHLDAPSVFRLLETMKTVSTRFVLLETNTASWPREPVRHDERTYWGITMEEPLDSPDHSQDQLWAALGNPQSFHPTEASLLNALHQVGYSSVFRSLLPPGEERTSHRALYVCYTTDREEILSMPTFNRQEWHRADELPVPFEERLRRFALYRWLEPRLIWRAKAHFRKLR
jgi:SAM-dependent methyltransferase